MSGRLAEAWLARTFQVRKQGGRHLPSSVMAAWTSRRWLLRQDMQPVWLGTLADDDCFFGAGEVHGAHQIDAVARG